MVLRENVPTKVRGAYVEGMLGISSLFFAFLPQVSKKIRNSTLTYICSCLGYVSVYLNCDKFVCKKVQQGCLVSIANEWHISEFLVPGIGNKLKVKRENNS